MSLAISFVGPLLIAPVCIAPLHPVHLLHSLSQNLSAGISSTFPTSVSTTLVPASKFAFTTPSVLSGKRTSTAIAPGVFATPSPVHPRMTMKRLEGLMAGAVLAMWLCARKDMFSQLCQQSYLRTGCGERQRWRRM
jgi:hypothetical protein